MTSDPDAHTASPPQAQIRVTLAVAAVIVVAVVALVVTGLLRSAPGGDRGSPSPPATPRLARSVTMTEAMASLAVLRDWDRARSAAWARGDVAALRRIYLPGSAVGVRDVAMLRRWVERGLRVRRMAMQVYSVQLRVRTERRIVLLVTDRLADAVAVPVGGGGPRALPRDGLTTRRLEFRLTFAGWVLAAAYDRPLATTAVTSGSENS